MNNKKKVLRELNLTPDDFMIIDQALQGTKYINSAEPFYITGLDGITRHCTKIELHRVLREVREHTLAMRKHYQEERARSNDVRVVKALPPADIKQEQMPQQLVAKDEPKQHAAACYTAGAGFKCICGLADLEEMAVPGADSLGG